MGQGLVDATQAGLAAHQEQGEIQVPGEGAPPVTATRSGMPTLPKPTPSSATTCSMAPWIASRFQSGSSARASFIR
jgi:uncharacterized protein with LGFP repeats